MAVLGVRPRRPIASRQAVDLLTRTTLRPEFARAQLLYGEWLRREGRRVDARAQLRSSREMFADAFGERARLELVTVDEMVRAPTADSLDELTPQEVQVASLAAALSHERRDWRATLPQPPHGRVVPSSGLPKLTVNSRREPRVALSRQRHLTAAP
jgi:hypothetical protein